jgi:predicted dinucleotide-binding enzyme
VKIAIIGTGNIGGTLGRALAKAGHSVTFGSRRPDTDPVRETAPTTTIADALSAPDVVFVAIPGEAVDGFVAEHAKALDDKLVVDVANKTGAAVVNSAATYRDKAPGALYARSFNCVGLPSLANPKFDELTADMFFACAPDDRATLEELIADVGLQPMYVGEDPEVVDGVFRLTMALAFGQNRGGHLAYHTLLDE